MASIIGRHHQPRTSAEVAALKEPPWQAKEMGGKVESVEVDMI